MGELILAHLDFMPQELAIFLISMLPIVELRGAIPLAVGGYHMSYGIAYLLSVAGNMVPAILLVYGLRSFVAFVRERSLIGKRFFDWLYKRTYNKLLKKHDVYGAFALALFVAVPLPVTGAWTASIAATVFNIRPRVALLYIFLGVLVAGIIVSLITAGIF